MRVMRYTPCALGDEMIPLGKQGEGNALRIEFDCAAWLGEYPQAEIRLFVFTRGKSEPLIPVLGREGTDRVWIVSEDATEKAGNGAIELVLVNEKTGAVIKSATGYTTVTRSPSAGMELREGEKGYVRYDEAQALTEEQKETARQNIGAGTGSGNAGIHIGPDAPEDENVVLWIDTDESGGGSGAADEGALLETLESLGLIRLMRDGDDAALADADGAVYVM